MKPYLVYIFRFDSTTEKNIEKIAQFFLQEEKSKQRTNLDFKLKMKKSLTEQWIQRIEVVIHF